MLYVIPASALQYPDIGIVGNVFSGLPVTQAGTKETHQFAIVVFQHNTWPRHLREFPWLWVKRV
ncbi:hypothetical protein D3C77_632600 [compost metagenome]